MTDQDRAQLTDEDMQTSWPRGSTAVAQGPRDADGTDADGADADGTDGDATDTTDGDATDTGDTDTRDS